MKEFSLGRFLALVIAAAVPDVAGYYHGYLVKNLYLVPYSWQPILSGISNWPWKGALFAIAFALTCAATASRNQRLTTNEIVPFLIFVPLAQFLLGIFMPFTARAFAILFIPFSVAFSFVYAIALAVMASKVLLVELGFISGILVPVCGIIATLLGSAGVWQAIGYSPWYVFVALPMAYCAALDET